MSNQQGVSKWDGTTGYHLGENEVKPLSHIKLNTKDRTINVPEENTEYFYNTKVEEPF